ncbi:MAG: hypothetical protein U1E63_16540 [Burkholderiales bacterium]
MRKRVAAGGVCLLLLCTSVATRAQIGTPGEADHYEDQLIDGGNLTPDVADDVAGGGNPEGWPRAFRMQVATSRLTRNDHQINESGIRLGGLLDTPNYGAFALDANLRTSNNDLIGSGGMVSLWQRGLPMNGGWFGNNALGVFNSPSVDLARQQYRFFIPTLPTVGAATEWRRPGTGFQLQASVGQPGIFTGLYTPTFEGLGGRVASGGMQWSLSREWAAAVQAVDVNDARFFISPTTTGATVSARSWYGGTAWTTPNARAQLNIIGSDLDGGSERAGVWLDGGARDGRTFHSFGGFRLPANLVWGNQPLPSNIEGGYYRAAFQTRQWTVDGGVDYVMPVSGGSGTLYAIGNARYQVLAGLGVGGGANVREGVGDAWSMFAFADQANRWGQGRFQANFATDHSQNNTQLTLDQAWRISSGARLSTSLLLGRENLERYSANRYGVAVYGGGQLRSDLSVDLNARWDEAFGQAASQNVLANASLNWGFASGWIATASYYENRNTGRQPLVVTSPIPDPFLLVQRLNDRGVFLSVRYDWQAGTPVVPLGGTPGTGSGIVAGVLFLDANDNGRLDAGEDGAANVTILLDGRFTVRTDAQGRFEFPSVGAGRHVVSIVPDNLPLPWSVSGDGRVEVEVGVRDRTRTEIPVRRLR